MLAERRESNANELLEGVCQLHEAAHFRIVYVLQFSDQWCEQPERILSEIWKMSVMLYVITHMNTKLMRVNSNTATTKHHLSSGVFDTEHKWNKLAAQINDNNKKRV